MNSALLPIMVIVMESGAVYSAAMIAIITTYALGDNSQYIIVDFVSYHLSPRSSKLILNHIIHRTVTVTDRQSSRHISQYPHFIFNYYFFLPPGYRLHLDNCPSFTRN